MVKSSKKLTKVLCFLLIMCLATSMVVVSSMCTAQAQAQTTASPLQTAILKAMNLDDDSRKDFATEVLETAADLESRVSKVVNTLDIKSDDAKLALIKFDALSNSSKFVIITAVKTGFDNAVKGYDFATSKFPEIVKKINYLVTNDEANNDGFKMAVTTLIQASKFTSNNAVVTDDAANTAFIKFLFSDNDASSILNELIKSIETLEAKGITTFSDFMTRAAGAINKLDITQIAEFKKYIKGINDKLYVPYTIPSPSPSTGGNTGGDTGGSTPSPSVTATATATATPTAEPSPTAVIGESDKQITSFSFKNKPEAKGVIFENLKTIIVKVPVGTDLKSLEPAIEYKGESIKPESGEKKDFSHPVFYTVTAKDKSKAKYVVIVMLGATDVVIEPVPIMPGGFGPYGDIFGHWAEDSLISLIESGVITGYPDGSVKPNNDMTRAEVITVLVRALGLDAADEISLKFKDLKDIPAWAQGYVQVGFDKGFIEGYPDNTFRALSKVTRAEFTVMAMKAFGFGEEDEPSLNFADKKDVIPDWAKKFVARATGLKIINGYDDNTFRPSNFITRAEVCAIIDRCIAAAASK